MSRRARHLVGKYLAVGLLLAWTVTLPAASDAHWHTGTGALLHISPIASGDIKQTKELIVSDDAVLLAADVYLNKRRSPGEARPTLLVPARYYRSVRVRSGWNMFIGGRGGAFIRSALAAGFAVVIYDLRGTGASHGVAPLPWHPQEAADLRCVCRWVCSRLWSNGRIILYGSSYGGSVALTAASRPHPSVHGVIARSPIIDPYEDALMPGGVKHRLFIDRWVAMTKALDAHEPGKALGSFWAGLVVDGPAPVDWDHSGQLREHARQAHTLNPDLQSLLKDLVFRDDVLHASGTIDAFSLARRWRGGQLPRVPFLLLTGWYDGGVAKSVFRNVLPILRPGQQVIIGPWDHELSEQCSPFRQQRKRQFDQVRVVLHHALAMLGESPQGVDGEAALRVFVQGSGQWRPLRPTDKPKRWQHWHWQAGASASLSATAQVQGFGRWHSLIDVEREAYACRVPETEHIVWEPPPLSSDMLLIGAPELQLVLRSDAAEQQVHAYLESFIEDEWRVVAEALLDTRHDEVARCLQLKGKRSTAAAFVAPAQPPLSAQQGQSRFLQFQPTALQLSAKSRLRLRLRSSDVRHFVQPRYPAGGRWWVDEARLAVPLWDALLPKPEQSKQPKP